MAISGWIATILFAVITTVSGALYLAGPPAVVSGFHHLGYPDYFRVLLGIAKLAGVAAIVGGRSWRLLREWAYAGFTFDLLAAALSHGISGDPVGAVASPLVVLALLGASYVLWYRRGRAEVGAS